MTGLAGDELGRVAERFSDRVGGLGSAVHEQ
jgi:hypothetical protein